MKRCIQDQAQTDLENTATQRQSRLPYHAPVQFYRGTSFSPDHGLAGGEYAWVLRDRAWFPNDQPAEKKRT